jgi:hypothetical protein
MSDLRKIPAILFVGALLGGVLGPAIGYAVCAGFDIVNDPPAPKGPPEGVGWLMVGGAVGGAGFGSVLAAILHGLWRMVFRRD